jgi:hypothetical protein
MTAAAQCLIECALRRPFSRRCLIQAGPPWPFSRWRSLLGVSSRRRRRLHAGPASMVASRWGRYGSDTPCRAEGVIGSLCRVLTL